MRFIFRAQSNTFGLKELFRRLTFQKPVYSCSVTMEMPDSKRATKRIPVLKALLDGQRLTQWGVARIAGTDRHGARSLICTLRKLGYPIFNERLKSSRRTVYFIADPNHKVEQVHNKVRWTMPGVPRGKHIMEVSE